LASSITGVLGLRLIRRNCQDCSVPYEPEPAALRLLSQEQIDVAQFRRGAGCERCLNTGFQGRTALTEMLGVDEVLRDSILQKLPTRTLQEIAVRQGMHTLWTLGLDRVIRGETTLEEITRVVSAEQM
jgi:type II secretory ATPase GspE/PulE/Tfp pilus assembly ATPase PilB-like protein